MLSVPNIFLRPKEAEKAADCAKACFAHVDGDHLTLLNVYHAYKKNNNSDTWCQANFVNLGALKLADKVRGQLVNIMNRHNLTMCSTDFSNCDYYVNIQKAMLAGYFMHVAYLDCAGHYLTVKDQQIVHLHPSCCLLKYEPQWVLYHEFVHTSCNFIRTVTRVSGEWLIDVARHYYALSNIPRGRAKYSLEKLYTKREREKESSMCQVPQSQKTERIFGNFISVT